MPRSPVACALLLLVAPAWAAERAPAADVMPAPQLPWHDPGPVSRLFLQLPFESADVLAPGRLAAGVDVLYSNSFVVDQRAGLALDVRVESAQPTLLLRYGLADGVEAQLGIPAVVDYGGFLDGPIETVERWLGATNPQRLLGPRRIARFRLTRSDGSGIVADGARAGLGDVWTGLKVAIPVAVDGVQLAVRGAVKLPSGRLPFGSEELDLGASLFASWSSASRRTAVRVQVDVVTPTARLPEVHVRTRSYGAAHLGASQWVARHVALVAQASVHLSPIRGTGLEPLDATTAYVVAGVSVAVSRSVQLDLGVAENVFAAFTGADITFPVGVRGTF